MWKLLVSCPTRPRTKRTSIGHASVSRRHKRRGRLVHESLEHRLVLDGQSVTLNDDVFHVRQNDSATTVDVMANDLFAPDYAGAGLITSVSYGSEGGSVAIVDGGVAVSYRPPADYAGSEEFVYYVDDTFAAVVRVEISSPLSPDTYEIAPDGRERQLAVMSNDAFWSGYSGERRITSISTTSLDADIAISLDGRSVLYTPVDGAYGQDSFIYIVDGKYPASVTISIPVTLVADRYELLQNAQDFSLPVLSNDPFWPNYPGEQRITHAFAADEDATVTIREDGRGLLYTPEVDSSGWDTVTYVVDGVYETTVSIRVHRPVRDDSFSLDQFSQQHPLDVLANDWYVDLHNVTRDVVSRITSVSAPESGGSATISADGQRILYTPPADFSGPDTLTYEADGRYRATARIEVTRPVRDDVITQNVYQDTPGAVLDVLTNDFQGNGYTGLKRITSVEGISSGAIVSVSTDGKSIRYTAPAGFTGYDHFRYFVDETLDASVQVYVRPLATPDYFSFCANPSVTSRTLDVLQNDYFDRGYLGAARITGVEITAGSGTASVSADGRYIQLSPGASNWTSLSYTVDGTYVATANISLTGHLAYDSAVVDQNSAGTSIPVMANDFLYNYRSDCNSLNYTGNRLITAVQPSAQGGTVTIAPGGRSVVYTPPADFTGDDSFVYVVDGVMESTVAVHVVRHVRDDQFHVSSNVIDEPLTVLVNDLFAADYRGARRITTVGATTAGGTVEISPDGQRLLYTPLAGFAGTDTFQYRVDDRLVARVQVTVAGGAEQLFPRFASLDSFEQFLIDDALDRYQYLFGQPGGGFYPCPECLDGGIPVDNTEGNPGRDHSETNVQVEGIDEGDIIEFDSDYTYIVTNNDIAIVDAWPAEEMTIAARLSVEGSPLVEFLHDDRLTVISQDLGGYFFGDVPYADYIRGDDVFGWPRGPLVYVPSTTYVTVFDVTDRMAPSIVQTTSMEGRYVESRGVGDFVYVAVIKDSAIAPPPEIIPLDPAQDSDPVQPVTGTYETRQQYLDRILANTGELVDAALPNFSSYGPDGQLVRSGLINAPEDIFMPVSANAHNLLSVVAFNVEQNEPGFAGTSGIYANGAGIVYASLENFYVFDRGYSLEDGESTRIMKFDWEPETGGVQFVASTEIPGTMVNQFSADEYDGYLRVATSISNSYAGNWSGRAENTLYVLREDSGVFEHIGRLPNLALNETIRSVRFLQDRAIVSTFRTVDPLFTIDLHDPEAPRAVGHITLPGYLSYMQMIDDSHLLAVGHNTPNGWSGPTQIVMFDVSEFAHPQLVAHYTFAKFSTSEATLDHHAFGYYRRHGLLALPSARSYIERVDTDGDGYRESRQWVTEQALDVFEVDLAQQTITLAGEIAHDAAVRRSGYIDNRLYSIGEDAVKAVAVDAPGEIVGTVLLAPEEPETTDDHPQLAAAELPATLADDAPLQLAIQSARLALAAELEITTGEALIVTAESVAGSAGNDRFHIVLRVQDQLYRYSVLDALSPELIDANYQFPSTISGTSWHNSALPTDVNGDGSVTVQDITEIYRVLGDADASNVPVPIVVRQIFGATFDGLFPDVNADTRVTIQDAFAILPDLITVEPGQSATLALPASSAWHEVIAPRSVADRYVRGTTFVSDSFQGETITLTIYRATAGDANGDGAVDAADFNVWNQHRFGESGTWITGDFNGDQAVDARDFAIWNQHKFDSAPSPASEGVRRTPRAALHDEVFAQFGVR